MRIAPPLPSLPFSPVVPQGRAVSSSGSAQQASADHGAADVLALSPGALRFGGASQSAMANIDAVDAEGQTALTRAALQGDLKAAKSLLRKSANIEHKGQYGRTPLIQAAAKDHPEMVTFLLSKGAKLEAQADDGNTALSLASCFGKLNAARVLVDHKANIEHKGYYGRTPLIQAASNDQTEMVIFLLNKGADIEAQAQNGNTALSLASWFGKGRTARLLVERGANPYTQDNDGWTAKESAKEQGHHDIAAMLERAEAAWGVRHGNRPAAASTQTQPPQPDTTRPQPASQPQQSFIIPEVEHVVLPLNTTTTHESLSDLTKAWWNFGGRVFRYGANTVGNAAQWLLATDGYKEMRSPRPALSNQKEEPVSAQDGGATPPQPQEEPESIHYVNLFPPSAPPMPEGMSMPSTPKSQEAGSSNPFQTVFDQDKKEKDKHIQEKAQQVLTQFDRKEPLKKADIDAMGLLNEQTIQEVSQNLRDDLTRGPQEIIDGLKHQYSNALPGSPDSDPMACIFWNVLSQQLFGKIVSDL